MTESNSHPEPGAQSFANPPATEPRVVDGGQGWNWIAQAWELFKKSPGVWIGNFILLMLISVVLSAVPVIGHIASHLLWPVMIGGLMLGCRALDRGEPFEIAHLFAGFKNSTGQLVMIGVFVIIGGLIIIGVVVLVVMLAGGGTLIAAVWGGSYAGMLAGGTFLLLALFGLMVALLLSIPLLMAVWFAPPLVVLRNLAAIDAMKYSFNACLINVIPFLIYGLVTLVLSVLASIPLALGWLIFAPVLIASIYTGYRDIFADT
jgi:uncharacterized membrane protein